jgi:hypothetical protein
MVQVLCAFVLVLCLAAPALAGKKRSSQKKKSSPKKNLPASENKLTKEMLRHLGVQYRRGGTGPHGLDCSGYVGLVYRNVYGLKLPHQSGALFISSGLQKVPMDDLKTGDLVFFTSSKKSKRISHVGIYLSEGRFVHAASGKGVIVSGLEEQYWNERIAGARRIPGQPALANEPPEPIQVSALSPSTTTLFDPQDRSPEVSVLSHSLGLELGMERAFHVSVFQDALLSSLRTDAENSLDADPAGLDEGSRSAYVQGFRVERDLRPFSWLVVTPSLSYFNYEGGLDDTGLPRRSVGLDLSLGSKEEGWTISTGFRYFTLIPPRGSSEEERAPEGFDMSLAYSKRLSETLSVSLMGERLQRYETLSDPTHQERTYEDQRFSVLFSFFY